MGSQVTGWLFNTGLREWHAYAKGTSRCGNSALVGGASNDQFCHQPGDGTVCPACRYLAVQGMRAADLPRFEILDHLATVLAELRFETVSDVRSHEKGTRLAGDCVGRVGRAGKPVTFRLCDGARVLAGGPLTSLRGLRLDPHCRLEVGVPIELRGVSVEISA